MQPTPEQKRLCLRVLNAFETGQPDGDYAAWATLADGPHGMRQVTYGRSQTTEYSNLRELVVLYVQNHGSYGDQLAPYISKIGVESLVKDKTFKQLLQDAARNDVVMRATQDVFFDRRYWNPMIEWATAHAFTTGLSALVLYDSFIHSGTIFDFLRKRFDEPVPSNGGDERVWITQYVATRNDWLKSVPKLQSTVYRMQCLRKEIGRNNWDLSQVPIVANGVKVV